MAKKIERAVAKDELIRINQILTKPYLLIGGLAVQQYVISRDSQDVDLVCDFEIANEILDKLYPNNEWDLHDGTSDEYRPSYRITHRQQERGTIIFGPKLLEREAYELIVWEELMKDGNKFRYKSIELENIIVPPVHALAYTKLVSIMGRSSANTEKIRKDLKDLISLTNHKDFILHKFYNFFKRADISELLLTEFKTRFSINKDLASISCLYDISSLFSLEKSNHPSTQMTAYLAGPHRNINKNNRVSDYLFANGVNVKVPYNETAKKKLKEKDNDSKEIRETCINLIRESNFVVVDLDTYGLDSAWEIGFADGLRKTVIGYNEDIELATENRLYQRRPYFQNFMHGWKDQLIFNSVGEAANYCEGKKVYVAGSFANKQLDKIPNSAIEQKAESLVFPRSLVENNKLMPKDYPFSSRRENIRLMQDADIVLVVIPRYGMDVSWQIGFATATNKNIIGLNLEDDGKEADSQAFWDHWMHGWKEKCRVTSLSQLTAIIRGIAERSS